MSNKSQINQLSKKEILTSLAGQLQQTSVTFNRFLVALALAAKVAPDDLAKFFTDTEAGQKYADELNGAIDRAVESRAEQSKTKEAQTEEGVLK